MGYDWAKDCVHVAFGMISYEGQSLSTRKGYVVYLEDLLDWDDDDDDDDGDDDEDWNDDD